MFNQWPLASIDSFLVKNLCPTSDLYLIQPCCPINILDNIVQANLFVTVNRDVWDMKSDWLRHILVYFDRLKRKEMMVLALFYLQKSEKNTKKTVSTIHLMSQLYSRQDQLTSIHLNSEWLDVYSKDLKIKCQF